MVVEREPVWGVQGWSASWGCDEHMITAGRAQKWWRVAKEKQAVVGWCECCGSPAPPETDICNVCRD